MHRTRMCSHIQLPEPIERSPHRLLLHVWRTWCAETKTGNNIVLLSNVVWGIKWNGSFEYVLMLSDKIPRREAGWVRELPGQVCATTTRRASHRGDVLVEAVGRDLRLHHGECARLASPRAPSTLAAHLAGACLSSCAADGPILRLLRSTRTAFVCSRRRGRYYKDHFLNVHSWPCTLGLYYYFLFMTKLLITSFLLNVRMLHLGYFVYLLTTNATTMTWQVLMDFSIMYWCISFVSPAHFKWKITKKVIL